MNELQYLAGAAEVGDVLGVHPNTVNTWKTRSNGFPRPVLQLKAGAIWDIRDVITWADHSGRTVALRNYSAPRPGNS